MSFAHYIVQQRDRHHIVEDMWHGPERFETAEAAGAHAAEQLAELHAKGHPWNVRDLRAVVWVVQDGVEPVCDGIATRHGYEPQVPPGWRVYHAREAGMPSRHGVAAGYDGDWHYQPKDAPAGIVWSDGYLLRQQAIDAAWREAGAPPS